MSPKMAKGLDTMSSLKRPACLASVKSCDTTK